MYSTALFRTGQDGEGREGGREEGAKEKKMSARDWQHSKGGIGREGRGRGGDHLAGLADEIWIQLGLLAMSDFFGVFFSVGPNVRIKVIYTYSL